MVGDGGVGEVGEGLGPALTPAPWEAAGGWGLSVCPLQQMVVPEKSQQHLASHEHERHEWNQHVPNFLWKMLCRKTVVLCVKLLIWGWQPEVLWWWERTNSCKLASDLYVRIFLSLPAPPEPPPPQSLTKRVTNVTQYTIVSQPSPQVSV